MVSTPGHAREKTVLIVDDDADTRDILSDIFQDEGYVAASAADGRSAADYLESHPQPCVIVLDLNMPVMNGWEFLSWKEKQAESIARIPVVTISSTGDRPRKDLVVASVPKPLDLERLLVCVDQHADDTGAQGRMAA